MVLIHWLLYQFHLKDDNDTHGLLGLPNLNDVLNSLK